MDISQPLCLFCTSAHRFLTFKQSFSVLQLVPLASCLSLCTSEKSLLSSLLQALLIAKDSNAILSKPSLFQDLSGDRLQTQNPTCRIFHIPDTDERSESIGTCSLKEARAGGQNDALPAKTVSSGSSKKTF